jgi:hypothetical protein
MVTTLMRVCQRLTGATPGKTQAELAEKYTHFQALLSANNQVLTLMADREEKLSGDYLFDLLYIRAAVGQLHQKTSQLVDALNGLGGNRYGPLAEALDRIRREVEEVLTRRREIPAAPHGGSGPGRGSDFPRHPDPGRREELHLCGLIQTIT